MKKLDTVFISYGALLILLGGIGWVTAHSLPSLFAGSGSGLLLMVSGWLWKQRRSSGLYMGVFLLGLLCVVFGKRYAAQGKSLSLGLLSTSALVFVLGVKTAWRKLRFSF